MNSLEETKRLLRTNRIYPNRLLGQNFMVDANILEALPKFASVDCDDVVLEVGAGFGSLSLLLSKTCKTVIAVEKDAAITRVLRKQLTGSLNVKIVEGDVLRTDVPTFNKVVSIPPYQISSRLLLWLFGKEFEIAVLILQKEFADRLVAHIGSEDYGWLSVLTFYHFEVELLDSISRDMFYPTPKVDSVIVRLKPKCQQPFAVTDERLFVRIVRSLFTERNRKVRNAIVPFSKGELRLKPAMIDSIMKTVLVGEKRVRELAPEDFGALSDAFAKQVFL
jgi:16S rRNA (adenine1518-N6/adenine1519-N6)-dimethyltransferase